MKKKDPPKRHTVQCMGDYKFSISLGALLVNDQVVVAARETSAEYRKGQTLHFPTKAAAAAFCDRHKGLFVYLGKV